MIERATKSTSLKFINFPAINPPPDRVPGLSRLGTIIQPINSILTHLISRLIKIVHWKWFAQIYFYIKVCFILCAFRNKTKFNSRRNSVSFRNPRPSSFVFFLPLSSFLLRNVRIVRCVCIIIPAKRNNKVMLWICNSFSSIKQIWRWKMLNG